MYGATQQKPILAGGKKGGTQTPAGQAGSNSINVNNQLRKKTTSVEPPEIANVDHVDYKSKSSLGYSKVQPPQGGVIY